MAINPIVAAGTRIYIESARSAAQTITAITKADPPVITYTGTDPANGSYVILTDFMGMSQLNDAVVKVANVDATGNTFEAKDQDSTLFSTFSSGKMIPVVMDNELLIATDFKPSGGEPQYANYQLLWDDMERRKFTHTSAVGFEIPVIFDPADANYQYLYNLSRVDASLAIRIVFKTGVEMLTFGSLGGSGLPSAGDAKSIFTTSFSINPTSKPFYVLP